MRNFGFHFPSFMVIEAFMEEIILNFEGIWVNLVEEQDSTLIYWSCHDFISLFISFWVVVVWKI